METIGLFEAKNKLSELVDRASRGQRIGITRRGKLAAVIVPVEPQLTLDEIFRDMAEIRKQAKMPRGLTIRDLIEEGRT
jgi:prevent-host-death family protein